MTYKITSLLFTATVLCVFFVCPSAHSYNTKSRTTSYLPACEHREAVQQWLASVLSAMKEPALSANGHPTKYFALRIIFSSSWGPSDAVRYESDGTHNIYRTAQLSGVYAHTKISATKSAHLSEKEITALRLSLKHSGYWSLPVRDCTWGVDGAELFVETIQNGHYRMLARWAPSDDTHARGLDNLVTFYTTEFRKAGFWASPRNKSDHSSKRMH